MLYWLGLFPYVTKTFGATFSLLMRESFHQNFMACWIILGVEHALRYYRGYQERSRHALRLELQAAELKTQLVRAQLRALNMQLQPHFLFNTLNAVMVLVRQRKAREAEEMLGRLSDLLRCVLEGGDAQEVPLRRELDYLRQYLSIEQVRFQDRLRVEIRADPGVLDTPVPYMGLQPMVENAVRHGIGRSSSAGVIRISASRLGDVVRIHVQDEGPLLHVAMNTLEKSLDPELFLRVHRSVIVNVRRIKELQPLSHGEYAITLHNGVRLQSGRMYHAGLKALADNSF